MQNAEWSDNEIHVLHSLVTYNIVWYPARVPEHPFDFNLKPIVLESSESAFSDKQLFPWIFMAHDPFLAAILDLGGSGWNSLNCHVTALSLLFSNLK